MKVNNGQRRSLAVRSFFKILLFLLILLSVGGTYSAMILEIVPDPAALTQETAVLVLILSALGGFSAIYALAVIIRTAKKAHLSKMAPAYAAVANANPSVAGIAKDLKISRRKVRRTYKKMIDFELIDNCYYDKSEKNFVTVSEAPKFIGKRRIRRKKKAAGFMLTVGVLLDTVFLDLFFLTFVLTFAPIATYVYGGLALLGALLILSSTKKFRKYADIRYSALVLAGTGNVADFAKATKTSKRKAEKKIRRYVDKGYFSSSYAK